MAESKFRQREDLLLLSLGFERMGEELWRRDGIHFGREAALQTGQLELLEREGYTVYEQTLGDEEARPASSPGF